MIMNITKLEQKTIRDSKAEVANLAWLYDQEQDPAAKEQIGIVLKNARFWHDIAECAILREEEPEPEPGPEPMYSKARLTVIAIIALILLAVVLFGCQTFKGVTGDAGWLLTEMSDNIKVQEK